MQSGFGVSALHLTLSRFMPREARVHRACVTLHVAVFVTFVPFVAAEGHRGYDVRRTTRSMR